MRLMTRGAAVLCANGQPAVDGIIPFLFKGDELCSDKIGVIMFQVKNDVKYSGLPQLDLFHAMDPCSLGILESPAKIPVIRIVFALAANTPSLPLVNHPKTKTGRPSRAPVESTDATEKIYTTYDFWVSGLSPKILVPVGKGPSAWDSILQASCTWEKIYSDCSKPRMKHRKSMNPGAGVSDEFWDRWCNPVSS